MKDNQLPPSLADRLSWFQSSLPYHMEYIIKFPGADRLMSLELHVADKDSPPPSGTGWKDIDAPIDHVVRFRLDA